MLMLDDRGTTPLKPLALFSLGRLGQPMAFGKNLVSGNANTFSSWLTLLVLLLTAVLGKHAYMHNHNKQMHT